MTAPGPAPGGLVIDGAVYDLRLSGTELTGSVTVRLPVPALAASGGTAGPQAALLAYFDSSAQQWAPVPASYDPATRMLTAVTAHLSLWSALTLDTTKVLSGATGLLAGYFDAKDAASHPSCPNEAKAKSSGVKVVSDSGGLVKWCVGVSDSGATVLRVANNRGYALQTNYPSTWAMHRLGNPDPLVDQALTSVQHLLSPTKRGLSSVIIPGGHTIEFTVPDGSSGLAETIPSSEAYLVTALLYAVGTFAMTLGALPTAPEPDVSKSAKAVALMFQAKDCVTAADKMIQTNITDVETAVAAFRADADLAFGCLKDQWKVAYGLSGVVTTFAVAVLSWLVDGVKLVIDGIRGAIDAVIYWRSYRIAVQNPSAQQQVQLTVGLPWGPYQSGYGQSRPRVISNGGDPGGIITDITWTSWGGPIATGTGVSSWSPPGGGWQGGVPAIVIAWDPGPCADRTAYRLVTWYFPSKGEQRPDTTYRYSQLARDPQNAPFYDICVSEWRTYMDTFDPSPVG